MCDWWEVRKVKLYGDPCPTQHQSQSSAGVCDVPRDGTVHVHLLHLLFVSIGKVVCLCPL